VERSLYLIKGYPYDIYFVIEEHFGHYFEEKVHVIDNLGTSKGIGEE